MNTSHHPTWELHRMNGTVVLTRSAENAWETYFLSVGEKLGWACHSTHREAVERFIWTREYFK